MGIKLLLPALKSITKAKNIKAYAGQTVAIDGYCWLHQAAYTCSVELAFGNGTSKLISYCQKKLQLLVQYKVTPILIFDGARLKMKEKMELERKRNREEHKLKGIEYLQQGDKSMAFKMLTIAVDITPEMAYLLVQVAQLMSIQYIVAPYEADAQLAYMYLKGYVSMVITEDSDLLAFGVKKCFFKMDSNGDGQEVDLDLIQNVQEFRFKDFTSEMLLSMCILSGCDYVDSIKGIGFKKAHRLVQEAGTSDIKQILKLIRREGKQIIPKEYESNFIKALLTFTFQRVYCPIKKCLVHLNDPAEHSLGPELAQQKDLDFLGDMLSDEIATKIAFCEIDPETYESYVEIRAKRREILEKETKQTTFEKFLKGQKLSDENETNNSGFQSPKQTSFPFNFTSTKKSSVTPTQPEFNVDLCEQEVQNEDSQKVQNFFAKKQSQNESEGSESLLTENNFTQQSECSKLKRPARNSKQQLNFQNKKTASKFDQVILQTKQRSDEQSQQQHSIASLDSFRMTTLKR